MHTYILSFSSVPALLELVVVVVEDEVVSLDVLFSGFLTSCDISTLKYERTIKQFQYQHILHKYTYKIMDE